MGKHPGRGEGGAYEEEAEAAKAPGRNGHEIGSMATLRPDLERKADG